MAVVKIIPNKKTPKDNLKYITDPEKTLDGELIFAHNTVTNYKRHKINAKTVYRDHRHVKCLCSKPYQYSKR